MLLDTPPRLVCVVVAVVLFGLASKLEAQDEFQGLGDLPGGVFSSRALGVSPDGTFIVGYGTTNADVRGFLWNSGTGMTQLDGVFSGLVVAQGVANSGRVVGFSPGLFGNEFATYWNSDGSLGGSLGDFSGGPSESRALGVSADGNVIVGYGTDDVGQRAFRWTAATGLQDLGVGPNSRANAISGNGSTIVGSGISDGNSVAFRWRDGAVNYLGDLPGGAIQSSASGVSTDGAVVVGSSERVGGVQEAFRWTSESGMVGLGILSGSTSSQAHGVSGDGSLVIGQSSGRGFIWDPQQGMRSLTDVLENDLGINLNGWTQLVPNSISADGLTIVGHGRNPNVVSQFDSEAFRIRVDPRWIRSDSGQWNDRSNWALGINPNELHDLMITPTNGLMVTKSEGTSTIRSLQLRATAGTATLNLQDSTINVLNQTTIGNGGRLTGNSGGTFNANGGISNLGTIDLGTGLQITGGAINNLGLVRGSGEIASRLQNTAAGEIRVSAGQQLRLTGITSPNQGLINVVGGTLEVSRSYVNDGDLALIYARDAELRFNGGLSNGGNQRGGSIGISFGTTDIYGDIDNRNTGVINISGGANVTFVDDLTQNGRLEVVRVGETISRAVMFGSFSGTGGFIGGGDVFALGDLRPGNSPASVLMDGNLYFGAGTDSYFELGGLGVGQFDQILVTGELGLAGDLFVSLIDGFRLTYNDYFLIADVGQQRFGQFAGLGEGSLVGTFDDMDLFITYAGGDGNDIVLFTSVPEPSVWFILLALSIATLGFGSRKVSRFVTNQAG